jgi:hypothetical protein
MIYLEGYLKKLENPHCFHLDMEYERVRSRTKALARSGDGGLSWRKIVPDLIYHKRGSSREPYNHLVLEVKIRQTRRLEEHDLAKLSVLTGKDRYVFVSENLLSRRGPADPADPPANRDIVTLPEELEPYAHGALLRLYEQEDYIC